VPHDIEVTVLVGDRSRSVPRSAAVPTRGPEFNEHGDTILAGLGLDEDATIDLKDIGVVA
jgi:hypothetical protein